SEEARADRSLGAGLITGVAAVASGGANAAGPRGDDGKPVDGVGQEDHPEAHSVHDDDQICGGDGAQSRRPTPTRTAVVRCPTGLSQRSRRACNLLYPAPKWIR